MARKGKFKREEALIAANRVAESLFPFCKEICLCGSMRRGLEEVGDLDFVIVPADLDLLRKAISDMADEVLTNGTRSCRIIVKGETKIQADFMFMDESDFGSAILHATGSKWFNITCRKAAQKMGLRLSQYGLLNGDGEKVATNEIDILSTIGMQEYANPETRSL